MVVIKIKKKEGFEHFPVPEFKTDGAGAVDLMAAIDKVITLNPGDRALVGAGFSMELPKGYIAHITPRSGLALRKGISIVNSPGIIDSDYRGEVGVIVINHGDSCFTIRKGDRIAQMSVHKTEDIKFEEVGELGESERGEKGFGSTGLG